MPMKSISSVVSSTTENVVSSTVVGSSVDGELVVDEDLFSLIASSVMEEAFEVVSGIVNYFSRSRGIAAEHADKLFASGGVFASNPRMFLM